MFSSDTNISPNIAGGSYSIQSRLDEVRDKLSNVYRKVKELESIMVSYELSPNEVIPEHLSEGEDKNKIITTDNYARESIFVVSIPSEILSELSENRDIEYSLEVSGRELSDALDEQNKSHQKLDFGNSLHRFY